MKNLKDLRIGVLMGGFSSEREVSLQSGTCIADALQKNGYQVTRIDVTPAFSEKAGDLDIDIAFIALHGEFGEDGQIQQILDARHIPYIGSGAEASRVSMDKVESKRIFKAQDIPTPAYIVIDADKPQDAEGFDEISFPLVVKPVNGGSSIGITIVRTKDLLDAALHEALRYDSRVIIEEYIKGRELTVSVLAGEALPVIELRTRREFYDYEAKYNDDDTEYLCPVEISDTLQAQAKELAVKTNSALGARGFCRVDIMMDGKNRLYVLELNTIPGFTTHSLLPKAAAAAGISFPELC